MDDVRQAIERLAEIVGEHAQSIDRLTQLVEQQATTIWDLGDALDRVLVERVTHSPAPTPVDSGNGGGV